LIEKSCLNKSLLQNVSIIKRLTTVCKTAILSVWVGVYVRRGDMLYFLTWDVFEIFLFVVLLTFVISQFI